MGLGDDQQKWTVFGWWRCIPWYPHCHENSPLHSGQRRNFWDEVGHAAAEDLSDVIVETVSSHMDRPNLDVYKKIETDQRKKRKQILSDTSC